MKKTAKDIQNLINKNYNEKFIHSINPMDSTKKIFSQSVFNKHTMEWLEEKMSSNRNNLGGQVQSISERISIQTFFTKLSIHFRDGYICCLCGKNNDVTDETVNIDHIIPKSKYQCSHPWNLQSTCGDCNIEKSKSNPTRSMLLVDAIRAVMPCPKIYRSQ